MKIVRTMFLRASAGIKLTYGARLDANENTDKMIDLSSWLFCPPSETMVGSCCDHTLYTPDLELPNTTAGR